METPDYSAEDAANLLERAARAVDRGGRQATQGDWEARGEAVYAPHWGRVGAECVVFLAFGGSDPEADAQWSQMMNPQTAPALFEVFTLTAKHVRAKSDTVSDLVRATVSLAELVLRRQAAT